MNAPRPDLPLLAVLDPEWQRLDTLVACLSRQRAGQTLGEAELARGPFKPMARILGVATAGVEPRFVAVAPRGNGVAFAVRAVRAAMPPNRRWRSRANGG